MREVLLAAVAAVALTAEAAWANPLDDAKAGLAAFQSNDNPSAIRLLTSALDSGQLTRSDQELAFVKRAEAYLAANDDRSALADANRALDIDPRDSEAAATRDRAQTLLAPPPPPVATNQGPSFEQAKADYDASMAKYEAEKQADATQYQQQVATYQAQLKADTDKHEAELAVWRADAAACKAGDTTRCGSTEPAPVVEAAAPVKAPPKRPPMTVAQQTPPAAPAPKPVKKRQPTVLPLPPTQSY